MRIAQAGAMASLCAWAETGTRPPVAPPILVDAAGRARLDAHGNALGGLRFPQVSAPIATYGVDEDGVGPCTVFGYRRAWSAETLRALYKSPQAYVAIVRAQTATLVTQRSITPEHGEDLIAQALTVSF